MSEHTNKIGNARCVSAIEQYELQHLATKYGPFARLAKARCAKEPDADVGPPGSEMASTGT
jgi:hypothetical protein